MLAKVVIFPHAFFVALHVDICTHFSDVVLLNKATWAQILPQKLDTGKKNSEISLSNIVIDWPITYFLG